MTGKKVAEFRDRFNELIESSPKSRSTIAQEFGVAKQTISAWITGQNSPRLPVVSALADYFEVSLGWLLGYDTPKYEDKQALANYEEIYHHLVDNTKRIGYVTDKELSLVESYRSLSERGQQLLMDRAEELRLLYGKKSEDCSAESV